MSNNGTFKAGRTKTGGRTKGTPNKSTILGKEQLEKYFFYDNGLLSLFSDIEELEPKDKVQAKIKLLAYVMPKLKALEIEVTPPLQEELSLEEVEQRLKELDKELEQYDK